MNRVKDLENRVKSLERTLLGKDSIIPNHFQPPPIPHTLEAIAEIRRTVGSLNNKLNNKLNDGYMKVIPNPEAQASMYAGGGKKKKRLSKKKRSSKKKRLSKKKRSMKKSGKK